MNKLINIVFMPSLPISGTLSTFSIFQHIYGRQPNVGEVFSLKSLVEASCLPLNKKIAPHNVRVFLGYDHSLCQLITIEWLSDQTCVLVSNTTITWQPDEVCTLVPQESTDWFEWNNTKICTEVLEANDTFVWVNEKICVETPYTSTRTYTAQCTNGTFGSPSSSTKTATSSISQTDADTKAFNAAKADAESKLVCSACTTWGTYSHSYCENGYTVEYYHDGSCGYYSINTGNTCGGNGELQYV
jgi:hypothetical protein